MNRLKLFFIACLLLPVGNKSENQKLPGQFKAKVIAIKDGDTIAVLFDGKPLTIRLAHIDCPEIKKSQPFAKAAKQFTSQMCFAQIVTLLNSNKFDRYKRLIAVVINDKGENVNKALVKAGLAWHFKKYSSDQSYAALEEHARSSRIGLWQDENPIPPWYWRHR